MDPRPESIKDTFVGKKCIVFGCGPSLNDYDVDLIKDKHEDYVFICIKQSFFKFKNRCNIHVINDNNLVKYDYDEHQFVLSSSSSKSFPFSFMLSKKPDLHLIVQNVDFQNSICANNQFHLNEIHENKLVRWGPGIMLEAVIPFIVLSGFSEVRFLGWDYSNTNDKQLQHFYDNKKINKFFNPSNGCKTDSEESLKIVENSDFLFDYLSSKGIQAQILSKNSYISSKFKRIDLEKQ